MVSVQGNGSNISAVVSWHHLLQECAGRAMEDLYTARTMPFTCKNTVAIIILHTACLGLHDTGIVTKHDRACM